MSDIQEIMDHSTPVKPKKPRKPMTAAQKEARLRNLQKGREKRLAMLKQKKQISKPFQKELTPYSDDYSSDSDSDSDSDSSSSDEEIIIRRGRKRAPVKKARSKAIDIPEKTKVNNKDNEIQELRAMLNEMKLKQNKPKRRREKTIVQVINNESKPSGSNKGNGKDGELKQMFCKF